MATKVKAGDIVHVRCEVIRTGEPGSDLTVVRILARENAGVDIWAANKDIVHVERAPLKVGDRVVWRGIGDAAGSIIWIDHNVTPTRAWIRSGFDSTIVFLNELQRADEPPLLKVGDKVRHKEGWFGTVISFIEESDRPAARVKYGSGDMRPYRVVYLADLDRVG